MTTYFVLTPQAAVCYRGSMFGGKFGYRVNAQHYAPRIRIAGANPLKGNFTRVLEWHQVGKPQQGPVRCPVEPSRLRTQGMEYLLLGGEFPRSPEPGSKSDGFLDAGQSRVRARRF